jgi:phytoene/squalene synthetase
VLDAIRDQDYDVLRKRPVVTGRRKAWLLLRTYVTMKLSGDLRRRGK